MTIRDLLVNLLIDGLAVPTETVKDLVDKADANGDGLITLREFYKAFRKWKR